MPQNSPVILIVDDSIPIRLTLRTGLAKEGYTILEATNGEEAVRIVIEQRPDLVLMDVQMPVMDGFTAVRTIREQQGGQPTPIVMLTASDDVDSVNQAFNAGATDYIAKPINLPLLMMRVKFALRDKERERQVSLIEQQKENARLLFGLVYWEMKVNRDEIALHYDPSQQLQWLNPVPTKISQLIHLMRVADRQRFKEVINDVVANQRPFDLEVTFIVDHQSHIVRIVGQADISGDIISGAIHDITEQRDLESQANQLNYYDQVTGLPNHKLFQSLVENGIKQCKKLNKKIVLFVIGIRHLTAISNAFGASATDALLRLIANELKANMSEHAICAKIDSSHFAVKMRTDVDVPLETTMTRVYNCLSKLSKAWFIDDKEVFVKISAGIAEVLPDDKLSASALLRMAKSAQENAKSNKDITIGQYNAAQNTELRNRLNLEAELHRAVKSQEFDIQYQPQINIESMTIVGAEALLRWHSPERGLVPPNIFIPILEETGLINTVGEFVIKKACQQQVAWVQKGINLRIGINWSAVQFLQPDLPERIGQIARDVGIDRTQVELEVTESATMDDPHRNIEILRRLRHDGFRIALDDFGTGYASFEYLLHFELDKLKIDKAFVDNITRNRKERALIKAMNYLSENLNLVSIAEGVETRRQLDYLDALGVREVQGYYICKPLWPEQFETFANTFSQKAVIEE